MRSRLAAALWIGMAALGGFACASSPDEGGVGTTPEFVRPQGAWTAEELHRDLIHCLDEAHASVLAELGGSRAARASVRREMRNRTSECMAAAGWVGRGAPQG
jgi:hypothetical protein